MKFRDSEMKNLGYRNVEWLSSYITNKLYKDKYLYETEQYNTKVGYKIFNNFKDLKNYTGSDKIILDCNVYLSNYNHPLPNNLQSIGGNVYLENYNHPLPTNLQSIGDDVYLSNYNHPLPNNLQSIGGSVELENYNHPLPSNLQSIGGYVYLSNYNHPMPNNLQKY